MEKELPYKLFPPIISTQTAKDNSTTIYYSRDEGGNGMDELKANSAWRQFEQTGKVSDYLLFKNLAGVSYGEGKNFDSQNPRNRFGTDASQFTGQKIDPSHF